MLQSDSVTIEEFCNAIKCLIAKIDRDGTVIVIGDNNAGMGWNCVARSPGTKWNLKL